MPNAIPAVPANLNDQLALRRFLSEMRNQMVDVQGRVAAPNPPSNLTAAGVPGGNFIQFTRSNGDAYTLWWSASADVTQAKVVDLGLSAQYTDPTGAGGVTRYYWVQARNSNGGMSQRVGPVTSTSVAPGTAAATPAAPPSGQTPASDQSDGTYKYIPPIV